MRNVIVLVFLMAQVTYAFAQDQETNNEEDKNKEPKEQTIYSEESPKSFTLDPMKDNAGDSITATPYQTDPSPSIVEHSEKITFSLDTVPTTSETQTVAPKKYEKERQQDEIHTLAGSGGHSGGFGALSFKATNFNEKNIVLAGFRAGWIINRSVAIGLEGYGIIPTAEYPDIDPFFSTRIVGGYGGLFLEPIVFSNKVIHVTFPVSGGAGWMGYVYDWEEFNYNYSNDLVDGDVFWYLEPGAGMEINVVRNFRIAMGVSYRFTQDLKLINTKSSAFDDWNYFLTLKFGKF